MEKKTLSDITGASDSTETMFKFKFTSPKPLSTKINQTVISVTPPKKELWFRTWPNVDEWACFMCTSNVFDGESKTEEIYIISTELSDEVRGNEMLHGLICFKRMIPYVTKGGTFAIWPVRDYAEDEKSNSLYPESALIVAAAAIKQWVRKITVREEGRYKYATHSDPTFIEEPKWPTDGLDYLLDKAFKRYYIESMDHPVIREYLGKPMV